MRMSDLHTTTPSRKRRKPAQKRNIPAKKRLYPANVAQIGRKDNRKFYSDRAPIRDVLN